MDHLPESSWWWWCTSIVPPGFRFHPTEEELVGYYLARKVASQKIDLDIIPEVDLYRMEPWDLHRLLLCNRDNKQTSGSNGEDECYYFFSYKDRKYPSGTRTNRATAAGFWKATGRDKPVTSRSGEVIIGMRKTLVFYKGRAPNGRKTDWIMHEYRLILPQSFYYRHRHQQQQEEGWVVCRAFQKPIPNQQQQQLYHPPPTSSCYHYFPAGSTAAATTVYRPADETREIIVPHQLMYTNDDLFESKNNNLLLRTSIPQLMEDDAELLLIHGEGEGEGAGGGGQAGAIDWNFLDTLLLSSSSTAYSHLLHDDPSSSSSSSSLHLKQ